VAGEPASKLAIEARSLTKVFGAGLTTVTAVNRVDISIRPGEMVAVLGPSGSGKTTLLTMLGALLRPTSGSVSIFGYDVAALPEKDLPLVRRTLIGFVFQNFNLLESLTAVQNVEVALNLAGVGGPRAKVRAEELLAHMGMGDRFHFRPEKLSGGERQRVAIARALANDPPLILADEPTANLDSEHGQEVVELLHRLSREEGKTVVIVSHDARILDVAERALWIEDGGLETELPQNRLFDLRHRRQD
jgi:putative ABC transport system ATP-binding protein